MSASLFGEWKADRRRAPLGQERRTSPTHWPSEALSSKNHGLDLTRLTAGHLRDAREVHLLAGTDKEGALFSRRVPAHGKPATVVLFDQQAIDLEFDGPGGGCRLESNFTSEQ